MRFILIIFLIIQLCFSSALGAERKAEESNEPELKFLKGVSKYRVNGKTKDIRPLKEFKVGKKYCLWRTNNWDEACQDAAMKYAFGPKWREFKLIALEFVELVQKNDREEFAKWSRYPFELCDVTPTRSSCLDVKSATDVTDIENLYVTPIVKDAIHKKDALYKNFLISCESNEYVYSIYLSRNVQISFDFHNNESKIEYFPVLSSITGYRWFTDRERQNGY